MTVAPPRTPEQRKTDTLARFERDIDAWVASADAAGNAYLIPLSFIWDGTAFTLATGETSLTTRNLTRAGRVRLAFGPTRDVVIVDGTVRTYSRETVPDAVAEAFAARHWDARASRTRYTFFVVTPRRILAWREENELDGRELMRDGRWLA